MIRNKCNPQETQVERVACTRFFKQVHYCHKQCFQFQYKQTYAGGGIFFPHYVSEEHYARLQLSFAPHERI